MKLFDYLDIENDFQALSMVCLVMFITVFMFIFGVLANDEILTWMGFLFWGICFTLFNYLPILVDVTFDRDDDQYLGHYEIDLDN